MGIEVLLWAVIYIAIVAAVCALLWWLIAFLGFPDPFGRILRGVVAVVGVVVVIAVLLNILPGAAIPLHR